MSLLDDVTMARLSSDYHSISQHSTGCLSFLPQAQNLVAKYSLLDDEENVLKKRHSLLFSSV